MGFADMARSSIANNNRLRARFRKSVFDDVNEMVISSEPRRRSDSAVLHGKRRKLDPNANLRVLEQQRRNFRRQLLIVLAMFGIALLLLEWIA